MQIFSISSILICKVMEKLVLIYSWATVVAAVNRVIETVFQPVSTTDLCKWLAVSGSIITTLSGKLKKSKICIKHMFFMLHFMIGPYFLIAFPNSVVSSLPRSICVPCSSFVNCSPNLLSLSLNLSRCLPLSRLIEL